MPVLYLFVFVLVFSATQADDFVANQGNFSAQAKEVCMKELGCFGITDDFVSLSKRPINVLPQQRETINTRFLLYTRQHPKEADILVASDADSIKKSTINPKMSTKFIVHGFMDSEFYGPWMVKMKDEFLMHGDYNIIITDWSGGNKLPYYQATANTRVVGAEIDLLIKSLEKNIGIKRNLIHIIGHSLGSHIAGYAGTRLKTLGRITACDPAEPYFEEMPASVRIDPTDAQFVDVIHTDAASKVRFVGFGMSQLVGHVDFFPNNGKSQPGCSKEKISSFITDGLKEGLRRFASCNHQRALDFMHYSINYRKVVPVGYQCPTWESFLNGDCAECGKDTKHCAIMGIRADEYKPFKNNAVQKAYYLVTSGKAPFWLYHYQVSVKLFKPKTSFKDFKGTISITLFGSKNDQIFNIQDKPTDLIHGSRHQYLITTDKELGDIKSVSLSYNVASINPLKLIFKPTLYVEYVTVVNMNVIEKSPHKLTDKAFCGNPSVGIAPKTATNLQKSAKCIH